MYDFEKNKTFSGNVTDLANSLSNSFLVGSLVPSHKMRDFSQSASFG